MAFEKGHKKFGGRPKGGKNKVKLPDELCQKLGFELLQILEWLAKGDWESLQIDARRISESVKLNIRSRAAADALEYCLPKKKSVEHSGINGNPIETRQEVIFDTEWRGGNAESKT